MVARRDNQQIKAAAQLIKLLVLYTVNTNQRSTKRIGLEVKPTFADNSEGLNSRGSPHGKPRLWFMQIIIVITVGKVLQSPPSLSTTFHLPFSP